MKFSHRFAAGALAVLGWLGPAVVMAQAQEGSAEPAPLPSALDADLFYRLLLGELNAQGGEPGTAYAQIMESALRTNDPVLYERAVQVGFQSGTRELALQAARAWKQAYPTSREANRYVLQILLAMNRITESAEALKTEFALAEPKDRNASLMLAPRFYARVGDKKLAATVVEQAMAPYIANPATAPTAWSAVGRLRLAAGDTPAALEAARRGQAAGPHAEAPVLLALELMDSKLPQAEAVVKTYIDGKPVPELRMGYARVLLDTQRYGEAARQLKFVTAERPEFAEAWLVQGTLQLQDNQIDNAEASIKRFITLSETLQSGEDRGRGLAQAYLSLSQIAEKRKDYPLAAALLDKIENPEDLLAAQTRRASILARQGKMDEARKLLRALPERTPADARMKLMAEVQLLRDNRQYKEAYEVLAAAATKQPEDADLAYDLAMAAEKLGNLVEMERVLRRLIATQPDYYHAYNALGYSLAERSLRLPEARELIRKALEYAPDDPFISDSLGWVEFRMGNKTEALRVLDTAYKARPDPEIAAHLGEVLWSLGERDRAQAVWKEAQQQNDDNETLKETLKRLRVRQ